MMMDSEWLCLVVTDGVSWWLQAESSTEMLAWINAFNEVLMSLRGRTPSGRVSPLVSFLLLFLIFCAMLLNHVYFQGSC